MALRISIGADPEMFLRDRKTGDFLSAHDLLPGTKDTPHKVDCGAVQVDGVAGEFNIDPSLSSHEFISNIATVQQKMQEIVGEKYEFVATPTCTFAEEYFKNLPEAVKELGCNPDFNAWTGQVNEKPDGSKTSMRTGAGHIHVGWTKDADVRDSTHFADCQIIAKQLDYYLGLYSLQWDQDTQRRSLYGKAGSFRVKPYGMEYRPLSNVWLRSVKLQNWVYNATLRGVVDLIENGNRVEDRFGTLAQDFINNNKSWWKPEDSKKSDDHAKLYELSRYTGLEPPPPAPRLKTPAEIEAEAKKPKAKFYVQKNGSRLYIGHDLEKAFQWVDENGYNQGDVRHSPTMKQYYVTDKNHF